jgi:thioredoxin reductase
MIKKIAVIGAGPIGLEAALYASQLGYEVSVFERGEIGDNLREWGHVAFFSPWQMNHSPLAVQLLQQANKNWRPPADDAYLTGNEYVETYLQPLSALPQLAKKIYLKTKVESIGREWVLKNSLVGDSARGRFPFRILTTDANGNEKLFWADAVLDASGVYATPNWLGAGGIPAVGEKKSRPLIDYKLRDISGRDRSRFAGKKILLIGAGYSAATTICDLQKLIRVEPGTAVIWAIREQRALPIPVIENDPLPARAQLTAAANAAALNGTQTIQFRNQTSVEAISYHENSKKFEVALKQNGSLESLEVDRIIANVGYGPDNSIYRELQIHECYASRGPMKLAAALLGSSSADCLQQGSLGADTLKNPEPNFYIIGNKSYGRNSTFLIRVGLSQIVEVFSLISGDPKLNLYNL